jgi:hypothetical protein
MKLSFLFLAVVLALTVAPVGSVRAQADDQAGAAAGGGRGPLASLSPADRVHLLKVRRQVLESNPALKTEQESLKQEREFVKNKGTAATPDDKKMLMQNFIAHSKNMRDAMVAVDPTIAPVLDQVDAKMKERFQQHAGAGLGSNGTAGNNGAAN